MRTFGKILTSLFIFVLVYSVGEAKDQGVISGRVTWKGGYGYIYRAKIYLYDLSKDIVDSTQSNLKGRFALTAPAGEYYISAEKDNLVKEYFPNVYLMRDAHRVLVSLQQDTQVNFTLETGGWIAGTFGFEGDDVQSALVTAIKIDQPQEGWYKTLPLTGPFPSAYALQGLLPGTYKILGRARGKSTEYYPGVQDISMAEPINVIKDIGISNIGFMLNQVGWGHIQGRVYNQANDAGINNILLYAYQWHDFWQDPNLMNIRSAIDGSYYLNVPAGDYFMFLAYSDIDSDPQALYYNNCYDPTSANIIHVDAEQTIPGINFGIDYSVTHNLSISGAVLGQASGSGLNDVIVTAIDCETGLPIGSACSVNGGQFSVGDLAPGRYLLMFSGTYIIPYFYPQSYDWQGGDVIQLDNQQLGGISTEAITQDYGNNGLTIAGYVRSSGPLVGARVYAYRLGESDPIAYARTDASGNYAIVSGLVPGYYNVTCDFYGYNTGTCSNPIYLDLMTNPDQLHVDFVLNGVTTNIARGQTYNGRISISGNYPNPFNSRTLIKLFSDRSGEMSSKLSVFNILGQMVGDKIVRIVPGENLIIWDASDFRVPVSSGTYLYHFDGIDDTYRMILLK